MGGINKIHIKLINKLILKLWGKDATEKDCFCAQKEQWRETEMRQREREREGKMVRMGRKRRGVVRHCVVIKREMGEPELQLCLTE